ncbi:MAG: DUF2339 domain-containing protein, partial [Pseudomonadota bacterium]
MDQQLFRLPIELRLLGVGAGAIALLALGWRLRERLPVYGLSLQGGGIGILYLTIFAALRLYALIPALPAFVLLVALTAFAGALAHLQNALSLAVLATVGGFLAPLLVSTDSGNHVALFSYYLIINAAILGLAWYRRWRVLNLLGFAFTFGVGALWGIDRYASLSEYLATTEPFLILFFLMYHAIGVLFALRQPPRLKGLVDGTLVFGLPVIAFGMQAALVRHVEFALALSALAIAVLYVATARWLGRRHDDALRTLTEAYVALAVAFATLAIPLALDARWTAAAWALEGAALVWIATRQSRRLALAAGVALIVFAGVSFGFSGWQDGAGIAVVNGNVLGGMLISIAAAFAAWQLDRTAPGQRWRRWLVLGLFGYGGVWWFGTGAAEIVDRLQPRHAAAVAAAFVAASGLGLSLVSRRLDWLLARRATLATLPLLALTAGLAWVDRSHWLAGFGWLAWPFAVAAVFRLLHAADRHDPRPRNVWHVTTAVAIAVALAQEVVWQVERTALSETWSLAAGGTIFSALALTLSRPAWQLRWPLDTHGGAYRSAGGILLILGMVWVLSMSA